MTPVQLKLREARESAGLTQVQLARKADVRQKTISDLETGKSGRIELDLLDRLCKVLGVELGELLVRSPAKRNSR